MIVNEKRSWGDAAIDGIWPGLVGGVLMLAYLFIYGISNGRGPVDSLAVFLIDENLPALSGLGSHLATSAVYGAGFGFFTGIFSRFRPGWLPLWLVGLMFGFLLWLLASFVVVPAGISELGIIPLDHLLAAHILYGLGTGSALAKNRP